MSKKKWKPKVGQKCLCTKPPSRFFKDDTLVVVPKDIGRWWSWVGHPNHAGVDDLCGGLLVETLSLRPIPLVPAKKKWHPKVGEQADWVVDGEGNSGAFTVLHIEQGWAMLWDGTDAHACEVDELCRPQNI